MSEGGSVAQVKISITELGIAAKGGTVTIPTVKAMVVLVLHWLHAIK